MGNNLCSIAKIFSALICKMSNIIETNEVGTPCTKSTENSSDEDSFVSAKGSSFLEECTMDGVDYPTEHSTSKIVHRFPIESSNKNDNLNPISTNDATEAHTK